MSKLNERSSVSRFRLLQAATENHRSLPVSVLRTGKKARGLIEADKLKIKISHMLPQEQAARAHTMIEEGHTTGKIVLMIA
jgi:NADPH:quinone reductase-like Zn-dependent oxidoreductase